MLSFDIADLLILLENLLIELISFIVFFKLLKIFMIVPEFRKTAHKIICVC